MTDRELLELAAKAAGTEIKRHESECWESGKTSLCYMTGTELWDPLVDDGDALRLAVKVLPRLDFGQGFTDAYTLNQTSKRSACCQSHTVGSSDAFEATRRAIVRAAAEIGRSIP